MGRIGGGRLGGKMPKSNKDLKKKDSFMMKELLSGKTLGNASMKMKMKKEKKKGNLLPKNKKT